MADEGEPGGGRIAGQLAAARVERERRARIKGEGGLTPEKIHRWVEKLTVQTAPTRSSRPEFKARLPYHNNDED